MKKADPEARNHQLYVLSSDKSKKFYVGITCVGVERRLQHHIYDCRRYKRKVCHWIRKYQDSVNITPVASGMTMYEACVAEICSIEYFRRFEPSLMLNQQLGGESGLVGAKRSAETCRKISAALTGKKLSESHRASISRVQTGRARGPRSDETKAKIGAKKRGQKHTPESLQKMSVSHKKYYDEHPELREMLRSLRTGTKQPESQKEAKMRAVIGYDGGIALYFRSVKDAKESFGMKSLGSIGSSLHSDGKWRSYGLYWCYADSPHDKAVEIISGGTK